VVHVPESEESQRTLLYGSRYPVYSTLLLVLPVLAYLSMRFIRVPGGHHPFMWPLTVPIVALAPCALLAWTWQSWRALRRSNAGLVGLSGAAQVAFVGTSAATLILSLWFAWVFVRVAAARLFS
jgi:hypothetical protein